MKGKKIIERVIAMLCVVALVITAKGMYGTPGAKADDGIAKQSAEAQDTQSSEKTYRVVGYLPSYRSNLVDKIDYSALTHLNLSFMTYTDGQLKSDYEDSVVENVVAHCRENDVKVLVAVGGGGAFDTASKPFHTKESRAEFIGTIVDYVEQHNLDGVDIDIESVDSDITANYEAFVEELKEALGDEKILTMAVAPWFTKYLSSTIYENFDFINLMTYDDKQGDGPVAPMSQIETYRDCYTAQGVAMDKMTIGVPFYGYGPGGYSEAYTYAHILASDVNNKYADECTINGNTVYYNGETTIREKAELSKQYGGIMIWELGQDSYDDNSLLKAIKDVMQSKTETEVEKGRVVGYFPAYRSEVVDKIDYSVLTHLNLSFMRYSNGELKSDFSDSLIKKVLEHCKENNVKVQIAIGGGGGFDTESKPFHTKESRAKFIQTIIDYVNQYDLDGVDVDVESEDSDIIANYEYFVQELREALGEDKILTMAVSPWFTKQLSAAIYENLDFINLMTYDYKHGDGPLAPMSQIETHREFYTSQGVSMDRMVIGVPFYGYGPGGYSEEYKYSEIVEANPDNKYTDECVINGHTIYYNGETTIREKAELSKQYGGIMIWELGQDAFDENSLLNAIKEVLQSDDEEETTTEVPTEEQTEMQTEASPQVPFGVVCSSTEAGTITVVMGNPGNGQTYNVYMDGIFYKNVELGSYTFTGITEGEHTITLTGVLNGKESLASEAVKVSVLGVTTEPSSVQVEVDGFQISSTVKGYRTIYSVSDPDSEVTKVGMVYGLSDYAAEEEMVVDSSNNYVHNFDATSIGKMSETISGMKAANSYTMTMRFDTAASEFLTTKQMVRAYAQLSDGTYVYSDVVEFTVYDIADYLYRNVRMNNYASHNYLYTDILSVVDSDYAIVDYDWGTAIMRPGDR